ncbi:dicarboxylate/amino acid:cation symporter [filamentous cyanobacterium CCP3]|nr:dicarboxylate/amino acid:cation symporter [filamentous cyanobacterium CCP3]
MSRKQLLNLALNPWLVIGGIVAGAFLGWHFPQLGAQIAPLGSLYSSLLQMCVIPILLTAVIGSISRLFIHGGAQNYILRLFGLITAGLVVASLVGIAVGLLWHPGANLAPSARATLGTLISDYEFSLSTGPAVETNQVGLLLFFDQMIPDNIFFSLSQGERLSVLFFSIVVGVALGSIGKRKAGPVLAVLEALYETFLTITSWLMYLLPLGLFCLAAGQIAQIGLNIVGAVLKLVMLVYLCCLILLAIYSLLMWLRLRGNPLHTLEALRESMVVALGTANSFAAIPSAMRGLQDKLGINKTVTDLVLPLGITLNPPGSVCHFALSAIFIADIYGTHLDSGNYVVIFLGAIFAGIAASGAPGAVALAMISIILQPLGLPVDVALILLIGIDPLVDPVITLVNVQANCATTILMNAPQQLPQPVIPKAA